MSLSTLRDVIGELEGLKSRIHELENKSKPTFRERLQEEADKEEYELADEPAGLPCIEGSDFIMVKKKQEEEMNNAMRTKDMEGVADLIKKQKEQETDITLDLMNKHALKGIDQMFDEKNSPEITHAHAIHGIMASHNDETRKKASQDLADVMDKEKEQETDARSSLERSIGEFTSKNMEAIASYPSSAIKKLRIKEILTKRITTILTYGVIDDIAEEIAEMLTKED